MRSHYCYLKRKWAVLQFCPGSIWKKKWSRLAPGRRGKGIYYLGGKSGGSKVREWTFGRGGKHRIWAMDWEQGLTQNTDRVCLCKTCVCTIFMHFPPGLYDLEASRIWDASSEGEGTRSVWWGTSQGWSHALTVDCTLCRHWEGNPPGAKMKPLTL